MSVFFFLVEITVITEGRSLGAHIETNGLDGSCTKLLSLNFFVFVKSRGVCRGADLDDFGRRRGAAEGGVL
jgi:hypothetical protein